MNKPLVALVGRPNVGKSTLFNRLVGERLAVTSELPGTTRDRLEADCEWTGRVFMVVDTGGIEALPSRLERDAQPPGGREPEPHQWLSVASAQFVPLIRQQAEMAIDAADVIVFVVDAAEGVTSADQEVADILRRSHKPVLIAANKADNEARRLAALEFYQLGLDSEVFPISALHGQSTGDLLDAIVAGFPSAELGEEDNSIKLAIVGRPNVGKSSLLNALLGRERAIVSPIPGTTRDALDTRITWEGLPVTLIDTAGVRRRGKIETGLEKYSVLRSLKAIQRCDVALLLLDAVEGVTAQDAHVAGFVLDEHKSVLVIVNKWDAVPKTDRTMDEYTAYVRQELHFLDYVPVMFISALRGTRVDQVLPAALAIQEERLVRIPTSELNRIIREALEKQSPPTKAGKRLKIYYCTQPRTDPPTFLFHVNSAALVHFSYERYLENQIRRHYPFTGTPLRFSFREKRRDLQE